MIRRLLVMIGFLIVSTSFCFANTHLPGGLIIGTIADEATADVTPGEKDVFIDGTSEFDGNARFDGGLDINSNLVTDGIRVAEMSAATNITQATELTITDEYMLLTATEAVTSTATPFISTVTYANGTRVTLIMTSTFTLTLQDADTLSLTALELEDTTRALTQNDTLELEVYNSAWREVGFHDASIFEADDGIVTADGVNIRRVSVSTALADTEEYEVSAMDGKAGWGYVIAISSPLFAGSFSFTAAGVVTLGSHDGLTTSDNGDDTLNVFDSGTTISLENQLAVPVTIGAEIFYVE